VGRDLNPKPREMGQMRAAGRRARGQEAVAGARRQSEDEGVDWESEGGSRPKP
jgi:hypothetical protein